MGAGGGRVEEGSRVLEMGQRQHFLDSFRKL